MQNFNRGETFEVHLLRSSRREEALTLFSAFRFLAFRFFSLSLLTSAATSIERAQRLQHVRVIAERQRRMQSTDNVQFRDTNLERLARFRDDLLDGKLEAIRV